MSGASNSRGLDAGGGRPRRGLATPRPVPLAPAPQGGLTGTTHGDDGSLTVPGQLNITVEEKGTTTTLGVCGEWDLAHDSTARKAIEAALERGPECVVLDLSRLSFIDSSGIHAVLGLHKRTARQNIRLVIIPGPPAAQRPFDICGLSNLLPFVQNVSANDRTARPSNARPDVAGSGASLSPPPATTAAESGQGR